MRIDAFRQDGRTRGVGTEDELGMGCGDFEGPGGIQLKMDKKLLNT